MARRMDAIELLRKDHQLVESLLRKFERSRDDRERQDLSRELVDALEQHAELEEQVFYPFLREASGREDLVEEAAIEHSHAHEMTAELRDADPGSARFQALMKVLGEYARHHIREEEEAIFPVVSKLGIDLDALGMELAAWRDGDAGGTQDEGGRASRGRGERGKTKASRSPVGRTAGKRGGREGGQDAAAGADDADDGRPEPTGDMTKDDAKFMKAHGADLSPSTQRAKWIHAVGERADRPGQTLATRNPDVIMQWAEEREGKPATTPGGDAERPRVLRFDFPGGASNLQPVSWNAWLGVFQERNLVFLFQDRKKDGAQSNFFRLDSPEREDG